nr:hypothetical protein FVER53263_21074 [Fusarium verticillioides]
MKWEIWSHPLEQSTIVVLWNRPSGRYIMSVGDKEKIETSHGDENEVKFHWYLEGADVKNPDNRIPVKFRSVLYPSLFLDLEVNNPVDGTPFVCWRSHNGPTQRFNLHVL